MYTSEIHHHTHTGTYLEHLAWLQWPICHGYISVFYAYHGHMHECCAYHGHILVFHAYHGNMYEYCTYVYVPMGKFVQATFILSRLNFSVFNIFSIPQRGNKYLYLNGCNKELHILCKRWVILISINICKIS